MALDGITTSCIAHELKSTLLGSRIDKIHQPTKDEIRIHMRGTNGNCVLLISANPSHPRMHFTKTARENPMKAPLFCMVLRKHIAGGKIIDIVQPDFERILILKITATNEMGDPVVKNLILEIMGKHSNIILTEDTMEILDAIKRITYEKSSIREILPTRPYVFPPNQNKQNPLELENFSQFQEKLQTQKGQHLQEFILHSYMGISPVMANAICTGGNLSPALFCGELSEELEKRLYDSLLQTMRSVKETAFTPTMYYDAKTNAILDFSALPMLQFEDTQTYTKKNMESVSELLEQFYYERDHMYHIKQKSADMRRVIQSNIDRCLKKRDVLFRTRKDTKNMEVWKKKGELITANIYSIEKGMTKFSTIDFYKEDTPMIEITLDATKSPSENAQKYFANYNKAKRTLVALEVQEKQNEEELQYLESVLNALESARDLADLAEIRNELVESGFLKKVIVKKGAMKQQKAKPMHYISSDGFHMYVGKSNLQNDELTLRFAQSTDIWLHTKEIPGSHVIIATNGTGTVPDTTLTEAGTLAAFFSRSRQGSMVPVDYTLRKNIKKPNGSKPGMVIYLTNQTMYITPSEEAVNQLEIIE